MDGKKVSKEDRLTAKQEKFCRKFVECGNASEAYRFAYDTKTKRDETVWTAASRLLNDAKVTQRIEFLKSNLAESSGITALQIVREHQKIAFCDATKLRKSWMTLKEFEQITPDDRACIKKIDTKQTKRMTADGEDVIDEYVRIECYDKQKSLESLANLLGYNQPARVEVTGRNGVDLIPKDMDLPKIDKARLLKILSDE